jgi:hypothetical protein
MPIDKPTIYAITTQALASIASGAESLDPATIVLIKKFIEEYQAAGNSLDNINQYTLAPVTSAIADSSLLQKELTRNLQNVPTPHAPGVVLHITSIIKEHLLQMVQQQIKLVIENLASLDQADLHPTIFPKVEVLERVVIAQQKAKAAANPMLHSRPPALTAEQRDERNAREAATLKEYTRRLAELKPNLTM